MSHELTLIVAATRNMGIGAKGGLPWTGLKKEMAYFARVTKRLPTQAPSGARNAVIMGRKTWDSIPPRFRPLKGRLNIVISRSYPALDLSNPAPADFDKEPVKVSSLEQALSFLRSRSDSADVGKVFVIGGAQIYAAALELPESKRVLLTRVLGDFECDAFFPLKLGGQDSAADWRRAEKKELDEWVGEEVEGGEIEENGTRYEFQMWEKA
ncbi:dihydrofolate reductase [Colletotrichum truncatum]|uniref:Dihydrofolate reductase n=1 Tax=Colletotrichum truncatum TaxID=5467 RepID=A0ACC3YIP9_COLTU|nr:dihydrofolate reductase [Colletotrichum truncatum]KAF6794368.1 dihydrofolate reductase [Colletotrichum truncatum]